MRILTVAIAASFLAVSSTQAPALATEFRCDIVTKYASSAKGCEPNDLSIWNLVDLDAKRFSRRDRNGCDSYHAKITVSGLFYTIEALGHGTIAKMTLDGSSFLEVATWGTVALVSFGACERLEPR